MIKLGNCDICKNKIGFKNGHILCKAFPDGVPYEHMDKDTEELKICNNGIGLESCENEKKIND